MIKVSKNMSLQEIKQTARIAFTKYRQFLDNGNDNDKGLKVRQEISK